MMDWENKGWWAAAYSNANNWCDRSLLLCRTGMHDQEVGGRLCLVRTFNTHTDFSSQIGSYHKIPYLPQHSFHIWAVPCLHTTLDRVHNLEAVHRYQLIAHSLFPIFCPTISCPKFSTILQILTLAVAHPVYSFQLIWPNIFAQN